MSWKKIKKNLRQLAGPSLLISAGVILAELIVISYLKGSIEAKTTMIKKDNESIINQTELLDRYNQLLQDKKEAEVIKPILENKLANKDGLLGLVREFGDLANKAGVEVVPSFSGETESTTGPFDHSQLTLTVDGDYERILNFLKLIDESKFLFKISDFNFARLNELERFRLSARGNIIHRK